MTHTNRSFPYLILSLTMVAAPAFGAVKLQVEGGRPVVDGVYVNGHGPYRFLVDTGSNVNLIETDLARKLDMTPTFVVDFASSSGTTPMPGTDDNEVALDSARTAEQKFLFTSLDAVHSVDPDIRGVLGQWFLGNFDYLLDLRGKRLEFGKQERNGLRAPFTWINARVAVSSNLGTLVLDSGTARLMLFGAASDGGESGIVKTFTGSQAIGTAARKLVIEGQSVWHGDAVTLPSRTEPGIAGLLPLSLFRSVYVCNSESYLVLE